MYMYTCRGSGRITDVYAQDFEALVGRGRIYVEVENTGDITADFSVSCCPSND